METQKSGLARVRTLIESPHAGVIATDDYGSVRFCSAKAASLFGYSETDVLGAKVADFIVADGIGAENGDTQRHINATGLRSGGTSFPIDLTVVSIKFGSEGSLIWIVRERPPAEVPLEDPLTQLPNKEFSRERIRERLERAIINQNHFALLIVGLDGFDSLNRRAGRDVGDAVLIETAVRLRHGVPGADLIGRLSGAEFCVIAPHTAGAHEMQSLALTLAESLGFPIDAGSETVQIGPKIGVALAPADGDDVDVLIEHAQSALDRAMRDDIATCFYGAAVSERLDKRRQLQDEIRTALETNQFAIEFLPLIDLATGNVSGAEALLRWRHPERGTIPPLDFIPLAEECGLMAPIGSWVIREALRCVKRWNDLGRNMRVSVNVSARQMHTPAFARQLSAMIAAAGCRPDWLELELTEGVAMQHAATVQLLLTEVRRAGVRVALDDFGTGYSSMAYLKSMAVDVIKIDRSFIDGLLTHNNDSSIVRAIVAFGLCTGREVRGEGVTSIEQARWLHAEGCDAAQGFFFSPPIRSEDFDAWLAAYEAEGVDEDG